MPGLNTENEIVGIPEINPSGLADGFWLMTAVPPALSYIGDTKAPPATAFGPLAYVKFDTSTAAATMKVCQRYAGVPLPLPGHAAPDGGSILNTVPLPPLLIGCDGVWVFVNWTDPESTPAAVARPTGVAARPNASIAAESSAPARETFRAVRRREGLR